MKENHEEYKLNEPKFLKSKGIYIILGLCVVASGTFAWIGVNNQLEDIEENKGKLNAQLEKPVEQKKEDIPKVPTLPDSAQSEDVSSPPSTTTENSTKPKQESKQSATSPTPSFVMPVEGTIIQKFSNGELVKSITLNDWRTHNGIDIAANLNDTVKAVSQGVIKDVYESPMWGTVVELELEDKTVCTYANLNQNPNVKKGQKVKLGDIIGTVGKTASSELADEDHLHFEMMKDGAYLNPEEFFQK